jgi:hypothetical protein
MQIFKDKNFTTGIEYRDKQKKPVDGSIIISDTSPEAEKILAGHSFEIVNGSLVVHDEKRPEIAEKEAKAAVIAAHTAKVEALKVELGSKAIKDITLDDLKKIVVLLAIDAGILKDPLQK